MLLLLFLTDNYILKYSSKRKYIYIIYVVIFLLLRVIFSCFFTCLVIFLIPNIVKFYFVYLHISTNILELSSVLMLSFLKTIGLFVLGFKLCYVQLQQCLL